MDNKPIILVSGQVVVSTALEAKFRLLGINIQSLTAFADVENLLQKIKLSHPTAIIFDLEPPQTQFDLLSAIKEKDVGAEALIFVWADLNSKKLMDKCKNLGADYCLSSTDLTVDEFVVKVKKILQNKGKVGKKI